MTSTEAANYHSAQIGVFSNTDADMVTAITMNYVEEAIGIAQSAKSHGMPVAISFTTGQSLGEAIQNVDNATGNAAAYYMINCAQPSHFEGVLATNQRWPERIRGLRANASRKSHAELNESAELDEGNPAELGLEHRRLLERLKNLNVFGGCCGTDHRHVEEICRACLAPREAEHRH
jgi:S-methylmethionine-dependent homocysteine/selenocysteine methylase